MHLSTKSLSYRRPPLLLCLPIRVTFAGIKVRPGQHILQVDVSIRLVLFQHDQRVCLTKQRSCSTQFSQFYQLQNNLKIIRIHNNEICRYMGEID